MKTDLPTPASEMKFGILTRTACSHQPLKTIWIKNLDAKYRHSRMVSVVMETLWMIVMERNGRSVG